MISIPFSWFGFTDWLLEQEAGLVIMFATFGTLFLSIATLVVLNILGLKNSHSIFQGLYFAQFLLA